MLLKEWFLANELIGLKGMPKNIGSISRKAGKEGWTKRQSSGSHGVSYEYHISSLPAGTQELLTSGVNDSIGLTSLKESKSPQDMLKLLMHDLNDEMAKKLYDQIVMKGITNLLPSERDERLLSLVADCNDEEFREIFDCLRETKYRLIAGIRIKPAISKNTEHKKQA